MNQALDSLQIDNKTREALQRLQNEGFDGSDLSSYLPRRLASVLVLLYSHAGILRVLLTTRSKNLRSHPGETALPGGRVDETDKDTIETAFREANEEVNLPYPSSLSMPNGLNSIAADALTSPYIHTLCALTPHIAPWGIVITPVVAYLSTSSPYESAHMYLQTILRANPDEVDRIFTHPLEAILDPTLLVNPAFTVAEGEQFQSKRVGDEGISEALLADEELLSTDKRGSDLSAGETENAKEVADSRLNFKAVKLADKGSDNWPYQDDYYNFSDFKFPQPNDPDATIRLHRFRSTASPIEGLTANILMRVATIAYAKPSVPPIEAHGPGQVRGFVERKAP
ncbi:hypothetical protein GYMLUDRAFT_198424 [Collybiopsis luxurians FD-317 M1]|uniref:Nudix hydrolase domain-containing protein n=1 Tax=Collybiopsis luxurians FD-317 M1 TaxID=944289 RepID=A0A0D0C3D3_9AGAR|nr:hypothetical protein GYMLUDRAFT_198424 [Collybiopsis luxurians FD-317 M1]